MTRKDYQLIANSLLEARSDYPKGGFRKAALDGIAEATAKLCTALAADNPAFDRNKFLKAARGMK